LQNRWTALRAPIFIYSATDYSQPHTKSRPLTKFAKDGLTNCFQIYVTNSKDDFSGWDTWCEWITNGHHSKRCTGRYQHTGEDHHAVRPRTNWRSTVNKDLQKIGLTCEEAEVAALDRRKCGQCVHMYAYKSNILHLQYTEK